MLLFGNRVFEDVIKLRILRWGYPVFRIKDPMSHVGVNVWCPYKRKKKVSKMQGRRPCEDGGRDWSHAAPSQGMALVTRNRKRQEKSILTALSNLLASLSHTGRRRVVLGHTLNTLWHIIIKKKSHNVLNKFMILCWPQSQASWAACCPWPTGWTPLSRASSGNTALLTLSLQTGFCSWERIKFCCSKPPTLWNVLQ